jgi:DNA-binding CsgD family transcriptional regulator/tetratricopeptide (TPR) repeat protein
MSAEYEEILDRLMWDYRPEIWREGLDTLSKLTAHDAARRSEVECRASRYFFINGDVHEAENLLAAARHSAESAAPVDRIRVKLLDAYFRASQMRIAECGELLDEIERDLGLYPNDTLMAWYHAIRGRKRALRGAYADGIEFSQNAIAMNIADPTLTSYANMTIAYVFQNMRRTAEAEHYALVQLEYHRAVHWKPGIAAACAFLGFTIADTNNPEAIKRYRDEALSLYNELDISSPTTWLWFSSMHTGCGEYEEALGFTERALTQAARTKDFISELNAHIHKAYILLSLGRRQEAYELLVASLAHESELSDTQRINLYHYFTRTLRELGGHDREMAEACWKLWEMQRDFDARTHAALLSYQVRLEEKIHRQQTELLRLHAHTLERDLSQTTSQLVLRTELLTKFRDEINRILRDGIDPTLTVKEIRQKLKSLPVEEMNWTTFDTQFTSVHPEFASHLMIRYPDLSPAEIRLCKLLRLNLKSSEIARLFSLSERTIETQRFAVRRKLGLKRTDSVADALATI